MINIAEEGRVLRRQTTWRTLFAAEALQASAEKRPRGGVGGPPRHHHHHAHLWSRRRFLQAVGMLIGAAVSITALSGSTSAAPPGTGIPSPVPGDFPFFLPSAVDPFADDAPSPLADPLLINDFNGPSA